MMVGARTAAWAKTENSYPDATWIDGKYTTGGGIKIDQDWCITQNLPVIPGKSYTIKWGDSEASGKYIEQLNIEGSYIRAGNQYNSNGERSYTFGSDVHFVRFSCLIANKTIAFLRNDTDGKFVLLNGKIMS